MMNDEESEVNATPSQDTEEIAETPADLHLESFNEDSSNVILMEKLSQIVEYEIVHVNGEEDMNKHLVVDEEGRTSLKYQRAHSLVPCDVCKKKFPNRSKMLWHRRTHDTNRPRYKCPVTDCDSMYASKQACELHFKKTHLDQGLMCPICHKLFGVRQALEVHMRYHSGHFPFVCDFCNKTFAQKGHLTSHMLVKHNNLRYICSEADCGKVFMNSISLRNHMFRHTGMPFECAFCDKGYPQKGKLKAHIFIKHKMEMSLDELESMRKFKGTRTRHSMIRLETPNTETTQPDIEVDIVVDDNQVAS